MPVNPSGMRIFVPAGPCVMGPARENEGPANFLLWARSGYPIMPKLIIGRYARIIMDDWFKRGMYRCGRDAFRGGIAGRPAAVLL